MDRQDALTGRSVWTEADFEDLGWHDVCIHAMAFDRDARELRLDIDYILEWIEPQPPVVHFSFLIAPATMVFSNVWDLSIDATPLDAIEIDEIERGPPEPERAADEESATWMWTIRLFDGEIKLRASGFRLSLRRQPIQQTGQRLGWGERGGISVEEHLDER